MARIRGRRSPAAEADRGWSDWSHPITVVTGPYRREVIGNPAEALSFMANRWTAERNDEYLRARHLASEFLRRRATSAAVRVAFLAAAHTAYGVAGISAHADDPVADDVDGRPEIDPVQ